MKRLNIVVSDEAKEILVKLKEQKKLVSLDEAADLFLIERGKVKA